jgi:ubiquinone/menaquinone biosynthesis C-methylase UbiE
VAATPLFDSLAEGYDRWCETPLGRLTDECERAALQRLLPAPVTGLEVLDVGCGTGTWALRLAELGARVSAVDVSPAMVSVAAHKSTQARLPVNFTVADGTDLPFPSASFDLVTALLVLEFAGDQERVVGEMARVLRPGGNLIIAALNRRSIWTLRRRLEGRRRPTVYNQARFLTHSELDGLLSPVGLTPLARGAAVYYPPLASVAVGPLLRLLEAVGQRGWGAGPAFIAVRAGKLLAARPPGSRLQQSSDGGRSHDR